VLHHTLPDHLPAIIAVTLATLPKATPDQRELLAQGEHDVDLRLNVCIRGKLLVGGDVLDRSTAMVRKGSVRLLATEISVLEVKS
jgi:hypothetical protein